MILGGQHFVAALVTVRARMLHDNPDMESSLPMAYRYCNALVLNLGAPWAACRAAAGAHQSLQHDAVEMSTSDICRLLLEVIVDKRQKSRDYYLNDDELFAVLKTIGVVKGVEEVLTKNLGDEAMDPDAAMKHEKSQVGLPPV